MKKNIVTVILFCVLLLSACDSGIMDKDAILHICGSYAVPGMFFFEVKGGVTECTIIEEDSYGRVLFSYSTINNIIKERDTVLVIFQKNDSDYIYFYEDICYIEENASEADLSYFKYINDWNKPFNQEKFSKRPKKMSFDLYIINENKHNIKTVSDKCAEKLNINKDNSISIEFDDEDLKGNVIYLVHYEENGNKRKCFMLVTEDYKCSIYEIPDDGYIDFMKFTEFKYSNGWNQ